MGAIVRAAKAKVDMQKIAFQSSSYEKNSTGLAGEYFVAAELYKRGYSVGMTIGNAKAVDLFVQKNDKQVAIQVKTLRTENCFDLLLDKVRSSYLYVFVVLNKIDENPDFFLLKGEEIIAQKENFYGKSIVKARQTINYGPLKTHQGKWEKLEAIIAENNVV